MRSDDSFLTRLEIRPHIHRTIAVVGGGGKTSLIFRLGKELTSLGKKVIVTTTTHMYYEPVRPFAEAEEVWKIERQIRENGYTVVGRLQRHIGKIASPSQEAMEKLSKLCDVLLVEADGAKGCPVKAPADHEPVIPAFADMVIGLIGLDCLGKPIQDIAHRPERLGEVLQQPLTHCLSAEDLILLSLSEQGLRKNVGERTYGIYLNKADLLDDISSAVQISSALKKKGIVCVYGSLKL